MKKLCAAVAALLFSASVALADYTITYDGGGVIQEYIDKYNAIRTSGGGVKIDGMCLSACTLVTMLPKDRVCVTPAASMGFHSATLGGEYESQGTGVMWQLFPKEIRRLVNDAGWDGLSEHTNFVFLDFDALHTIYNECQ
jgi:hypothetical protein